MHVLVTGATGFVGLNIVEQLLAAGDRVVAFSAHPFPGAVREAFAALPGTLVEMEGDVRDAARLGLAFSAQDIEAVVHTAAITSDAARELSSADRVISVNLEGLATTIASAGRAGVRRFVFVSSVGVYGTGPEDGAVLDETRPHSPATLYGITKSAGEAIAQRLCALHGMDCVVGRLGPVFGPYEYSTGLRDTLSAAFVMTALALAGTPLVLPRPARKNWHYARDAAASLIVLTRTPEHRHADYNLGPSQIWTMAEWCAKLGAHYERASWSLGDGPGSAVGLWSPRDGGILSGARFEAEFGPAARFGLDAAFADYMTFLDDPAHATFIPTVRPMDAWIGLRLILNPVQDMKRTMTKPLITIVDPQHPERDLEDKLCGSAFDLAIVPYDMAPGTPLADDCPMRAHMPGSTIADATSCRPPFSTR